MVKNMKFKRDNSWYLFLAKLPRNYKKLIQFIFDLLSLILICLFSLKIVDDNLIDKNFYFAAGFYVIVSLFGLWFAGIYKVVVRFSGVKLLEFIILVQLISILLLFTINVAFNVDISPVTFLLIFLLSIFILAGARLFAREIIYYSRPAGNEVIIYGAGKVGMQHLASIKQDSNYEVVGFIDDDKTKQGSRIQGVNVYAYTTLHKLVDRCNITMIVLAMPNASTHELRSILDRLEPFSIIVKTIPKISDYLNREVTFKHLEDVKVEDILGRQRVLPDEELMAENIFNKVVLVTGAGGSIGSELCRQILIRAPKKLILIDLSELALYQIQQELHSEWGKKIKLILGSVADFTLMKNLMINEEVKTVYHAAAYKHVPLVEANPFSAIYNNVFGTKIILNAAIHGGVSSFTLISSDKAVRPTNIMGASKRLAEIICQLASIEHSKTIRIAIVRFGNVIGSSGSAIPKFREQIRNGGPVTVTDPEITRFFMAIPEAVELVLQASSLAKGGEVFLLDMGKPIKIVDLVKRLIRLSGNIVGSIEKPQENAIYIEFTGLRPGEKLYEELLLSGDAKKTKHPKIKKLEETYPKKSFFKNFLKDLEEVSAQGDVKGLRRVLSDDFIGYSHDRNNITNDIRYK